MYIDLIRGFLFGVSRSESAGTSTAMDGFPRDGKRTEVRSNEATRRERGAGCSVSFLPK